jgi:hypothetical protein
MAYEEVLFPTYFCAKKQYCGRIHRDSFNEKNELFLRGINIVKRKISKLCEKIGTEFVTELLNPYNTKTLEELCKETMMKVITDRPTFELQDVIG